MTDEFYTFHNRLRMLLNIDKSEFDEALGRETGMEEWQTFRDHPHMQFIRMPENDTRNIWALLMEKEGSGHDAS